MLPFGVRALFLKLHTGRAQTLTDGNVFGNREETAHALGNLWTDALNGGNVLLARQHEGLKAPKPFGKRASHICAHKTDAHAKEGPRKAARTALVNLGHELLGDGLPHRDAVAGGMGFGGGLVDATGPEIGKGILGQPIVEICHVAEQPLLDHTVNQLIAQPVNVHRTAATPVDEALGGLRGAVDGNAAICHLSFLPHDQRTAARAMRGHLPEGPRRMGKVLFARKSRPHDLRDHVTGLVNHDRIADTHVLASDLVDVVQSRTGNRGTRNRHRVELRNRSEHACAPHLHANLAQDGGFFFRRELEGNGPARGARREPKGILRRKGINLHDDAVDVVVELVAMRERVSAKSVHLCRVGAALGVGVH